MESCEVPTWSSDGAAGCPVQQLELTGASLENIQHGFGRNVNRCRRRDLGHLRRGMNMRCGQWGNVQR